MEIKKDLEFRRPPKISGNPPPHNKDKYFDFYEAASHHTEGCMALRLLIEKFIKNGKLVRFLGEHRNQSGNDRLGTTNLEIVSPRIIVCGALLGM